MRGIRRSNRINYSTSKPKPKKLIGVNLRDLESSGSISVYRPVTTAAPANIQYTELSDFASGMTDEQFDLHNEQYKKFTNAFLSARLSEDFDLHLKLGKGSIVYYVTLCFNGDTCHVEYYDENQNKYTSKEYFVEGTLNDLVIPMVDTAIPEDLDTYFEIYKPTNVVLDINTNLGFFKNGYLTMIEIPFLSNMNWPEEGRCKITGYNIEVNGS